MSLRQQNKARTRTLILQAAQALIAEDGVEAATTREIAKLAGVSYQTLYNYFPTKADIAVAILETEVSLWRQSADTIIKRFDGDLLGSLGELIKMCVDEINGPHKDLWAYIALSAMNKEFSPEDVGAAINIAHEQLHALLKLAQGMGYLRSDLDLHLMAHALFNLIDYAMLRYFIEPVDDDLFLANQRELIALLIDPYLT